MDRVAITFIDLTVLSHLMQLPADHSFIHASWHAEKNVLALTIKGPQLPICPLGALMPTAYATVEVRQAATRITWKFPQSKALTKEETQ